jgi:hypothetical protein
MKTNIARTLLVLGVVLMATLAPLQAHAAYCSYASLAGQWAYTYAGTLFTSSGPLPVASVGHFTQDHAGKISGSQTRSVAGQSGVEGISGTLTVNSDCTASGPVDVIVNGQLQRTAVLALVYDSDGKHLRAIFQSLTASDGTNIPVVITIDGNMLKD